MRHKPFIVERPLVENDAQFIAGDLQDIPQLVREPECIFNICPIFRIYKMKGDKSRLVFRQFDAQPFFYKLQRVASQIKLVGVEPLDLPQER